MKAPREETGKAKTTAAAGRAEASPAANAEAGGEEKKKRQDGTRETIESVVVAFILAFLFRTFEAEAFVIPTGSMAPTLLGRHKDIECEQCGAQFTVGASDEVDATSGWYLPHFRIHQAACPNCRHVMTIRDLPVFKGDRILVNKFPYEFRDPHRWDVVVFKYPEDPKTNYIKRLVGLPGEKLEIRQGDVYAHRDGKEEILRKEDPDKQRELQILVYDNNHPARSLLTQGWPERWAPVRPSQTADAVAGWVETDDGWTPDPQSRSFVLLPEQARGDERRWVRYRHLIPDDRAWEAVTADPPRKPAAPRPQLITDFCGYNAYGGGHQNRFDDEIEEGLYWVGDLTVSLRVEVQSVEKDGELLLELNEGARKYRCRIDLGTGMATLFYPSDLSRDLEDESDRVVLGTAACGVRGTGTWDVSFANVDDRLSLWVNGDLVEFEESTAYQPYGGLPVQRPWNEDLAPAGVAGRGAGLQISNLLLERDIYYRGEYLRPQDYRLEHPNGGYSEYTGDDSRLRELVFDPQAWGEQYERHLLRNDRRIEESTWLFELGPDEFFMMGDNSPRSKDSRLWSNERGDVHRHAVPRSALVGKAFFVYWPHGEPFLNDGKGYPDDGESILNNPLTAWLFYHKVPVFDRQHRIVGTETTDYPSFRIPFYPQVGRMERIR